MAKKVTEDKMKSDLKVCRYHDYGSNSNHGNEQKNKTK